METPSADLGELLVKAYQGEVFGEALFAALAERWPADDTDRRAKLDVLVRLESSTKDALRPTLERHGLPTVPDRSALDTGARFAEAAAAMPWADLLATFEPTTRKFVAIYEAIGAAGEDAEAVEMLLAHERALCEFARRELEGRTDDSVDPILALPHVH